LLQNGRPGTLAILKPYLKYAVAMELRKILDNQRRLNFINKSFVEN
jgi:hypothetical protein